MLFEPHNEKPINIRYNSKHNRKCENQVVLWMITNGEQWRYIALKRIRTYDGFNRPIRSLSRLFEATPLNNLDKFLIGRLNPSSVRILFKAI